MSDDARDEDELLPAYRGEEHVQAIGGSPHHVGFLAAAHADLGGPDRPVLQVSADERRAFHSRSERRLRVRSLQLPLSLSVMPVVAATRDGWLAYLEGQQRWPVHSWEPSGEPSSADTRPHGDY